MNIENLFTILLHSPIHQIIKFIISNINNINNDYLWKLIYIRKHKANNTLTPYDSYILCHTLINLNTKMDLKMNIYKLYQTITLRTCYNHSKRIPNKIGQLINLQQFYVSFNQLHSIPNEIGQLINLRFFDISYNQLQSIPTEIGQLINLQQFN